MVPSANGRDSLHGKVVSNIQEVRARGAFTIVIAEEGDEAVKPYARPPHHRPGMPLAVAAPAGNRAPADFRMRTGRS